MTMAVACSKDDEAPGDPVGTVILNMYNEQNGKTILDDSDIYINDAENFVSENNCQLFMLGQASGLGAVQVADLKNPVPQVAVVGGYGYVAVRGAAARMFPSQCVALPIDPELKVNYLKFYVVNFIRDAEQNNLGAVVKFVIEKPQSHWLPEWGTTVYRIENCEYLGQEFAVTFPGDNFEFEFDGNSQVECEKRGRQLVFRLLDWPYETHFELLLRVGESYTKVFVEYRG